MPVDILWKSKSAVAVREGWFFTANTNTNSTANSSANSYTYTSSNTAANTVCFRLNS